MTKRLMLLAPLLLAACATGTTGAQGQDTSQGTVDQNVRAGVFASYTGKDSPAVASTTTLKGSVDGKDVSLEVTAAAPFVVVFGDLNANTDVGTQGSQAGSGTQAKTDTSTPTSTTTPTANVSGVPGVTPGQ